MHLTQRPCYQWGSPCQNRAGNQTTQRLPEHCKVMQTEVLWTCLLFIRSCQNHPARHSERWKKTRQTGRGGKTTSGNGCAWSSRSPRGQWRTEKTGGNWLWGNLLSPDDPCGYMIGKGEGCRAKVPVTSTVLRNVILLCRCVNGNIRRTKAVVTFK